MKKALFFSILFVLFASYSIAQNQVTLAPLNGPYGLEVRELIINQTSIFANVINQGIYRSDDFGNTWTISFPGTAENLQKDSSGYIYCYSKESIYRTHLTESTWTKIADNLDAYGVSSTGVVVFSKTDRELFKSVNHGDNFVLFIESSILNGWPRSISYFGDNQNFFFGAYGTSGRSTIFSDDGSQYTEINIPDDPVIYKAIKTKEGVFLAFSFNDGIYRSGDGGISWQHIAVNLPQGSYFSDIAQGSNGEIWAISRREGIFISDQNALVWEKRNDLNFGLSPIKIAQNDEGNLAVAGTSTCDINALTVSTDNWQNFISSDKSFNTPPFVEDIYKIDQYLFATSCGNRVYSPDEGLTWFPFTIFDSIELNLTAPLFKSSDGKYWAGCSDSKLRVSDNQGLTWSVVNHDPDSMINDIRLIHESKDGLTLFINDASHLYASIDGGVTWELRNWNNFTQMAHHPNGDIYGYRSSNVLAKSVDNGFTFTNSIIDSSSLLHIVDLQITNAGSILVLADYFSGFKDFFVSKDNGQSYTKQPLNFNPTKLISNSVGHIFSHDSDAIYRSTDQGETWESISFAPNGESIKDIYISDEQYLFVAITNLPIHRSTAPTTYGNLLLGNAFLDENGNCDRDSNEIGDKGWIIKATNTTDSYQFTTTEGNFNMFLQPGDYDMTIIPPTVLYSLCPPESVTISSNPNDTTIVTLGVEAIADCPYLSVDIGTVFLRRCFANTLTVHYCNNGTKVAQNAYIEVVLDPFFDFLHSSIPFSTQTGQVFSFPIGDIAVGECGFFNISGSLSCDATLGELHCFTAHIYPDDLCIPEMENTTVNEFCIENIGSFDPNDKAAFIDGMPADYDIKMNQDLEYLIRFQNTGTDTAFTVKITDQISPYLDLESLIAGASSHPYTLDFTEGNALQFTFSNILLPDSNINEAASHGFVKFKIKQKEDLPYFTKIDNFADIFFDFNEPIRTNTVELQITPPLHTWSAKPNYHLNVQPNPARNFFSITSGAAESIIRNARIEVRNTLGQSILSQPYTTDYISCDALPKGLYFIYLLSDKNQLLGSSRLMIE